jgi:HD-like signal output (HDOD) protein
MVHSAELSPALSDESRHKILRAVSALPPFSPVLRRTLATLNQPEDEISLPHIAADVQKDTVLAGKILSVANSGLYCRGYSINSVGHAVSRLGLSRVRKVILGLSINRLWAGMNVPDDFSMLRFNLHALAVATLADLLVQRVPVPDADGAFVAGLFHDIGQLVLMQMHPIEYSVALRDIPFDGPELVEREMALFGFTHGDVSAEVTALWKLPPCTQIAVRGHELERVYDNVRGLELSDIIHIADRYVAASGWSVIDHRSEIDTDAILVSAGLDPAEIRREFLLQFNTLSAA